MINPFILKKNYWTLFFTFGAILLICNLHLLMHFRKKFSSFSYSWSLNLFLLTCWSKFWPTFRGFISYLISKESRDLRTGNKILNRKKAKRRNVVSWNHQFRVWVEKMLQRKKTFNDFVSLFSYVHRNGSKHFFA